MLTLLVAVSSAEAKYWKIGPSSVTGMDFASINDAMNSSNVSAGDTLYLDQYYNESAVQTVTKKVVIIGTGYDTSFTDEQVVATLTNTLELKNNGAVVKSTKLNQVHLYATDCTVERCFSNGIQSKSTSTGLNHIYSCYIVGSILGYSSSNYSIFDVQNCVIVNSNEGLLQFMNSSIINNNIIINSSGNGSRYCLSNINNSQITNNIIIRTYESACTIKDVGSGSGNSIEHNILSNPSALTYFPNNKIGWEKNNYTSLFLQSGNYSDYYKLATESGDNPAIGYATDGGEVGCHGGMFGCPSGGRPQYIPYFTKVTVGSRSENAKLPVSVSIKIQDE